MASIRFCDKTESNSLVRSQLNGIDLSADVDTLRKAIAGATGKAVDDFELIHTCRQLKNGRSLKSCGIKDGSLIYIFKKMPKEPAKTPPLDKAEVEQVVTAFQAALINSNFRHTVDSMLSKQETLENIMAATPGLASDPVAIAMLQSPELLNILADPQHIEGLLERHPSLGHAAMFIAAAVSEEGAQSSASSSSARAAAYSLDQMSDDEEMMDTSSGGSQGQRQAITPSQLAAALAMASGVPPSPSTSGNASLQPITTDFLQQALSRASGIPPRMSSSGEDPFREQLEQLRAMGIEDEVVARHALEAAGGNLPAAIQILFGDPSA